jgi:hypothetical protein
VALTRGARHVLIDQIAPEHALGRADLRFLSAPQPKVFAAIQQVCPTELSGFGSVAWLTPFEAERPLYAQLLGAGYTVLATLPLREVVIGRVGRLTRPFAPEPRVRDKRAFLEFAERGHIKVLIGFELRGEERAGEKGTVVTATLRVWSAAPDGGALVRAGWPALGAVGGVASRSFLGALARRVGV